MALYEFRLPELGEGLHEGRIEKWLIKPGDVVKEDDALAEVENDKALVELPSPVDGKIVEIKVADGTTAVVGDVLLLLEVEGAGNATANVAGPAASTAPATAAATAAPAVSAPTSTPAVASPTPAAPAAHAPAAQAASTVVRAAREVLATPGVRKFAREHNVDITAVLGTGSNGKITKQDVESFLAGGQTEAQAQATETEQETRTAAAAAPANSTINPELLEERIPTTLIRKRIAEAMVKSKYTAPHVTVMDEVEVSELVALRKEIKPLASERGTKITYLPFIVKALIAAIRLHPKLNSSLDEETGDLILKHYYNIGIATDTDRGLVVPVVRNADHKNMWTIAAEINDLATRARDSKLSAGEMKGSTISITNIGSAGGMFFTPVINYPEVAILGVGRITEKPVMKNGQVVGGQMMALSLSFDHRVIDGALAQHFINDIKRLLENPRLLLMEV